MRRAIGLLISSWVMFVGVAAGCGGTSGVSTGITDAATGDGTSGSGGTGATGGSGGGSGGVSATGGTAGVGGGFGGDAGEGTPCTSDDQCIKGLKCCYPCGMAGCENQCITPMPNGECPMYP